MGMSIDNSIALLEKYLTWQKLHGMNGSGIDEATNKLLEVAKKYQKIAEIVTNNELEWGNTSVRFNALLEIKKVIESEKTIQQKSNELKAESEN